MFYFYHIIVMQIAIVYVKKLYRPEMISNKRITVASSFFTVLGL